MTFPRQGAPYFRRPVVTSAGVQVFPPQPTFYVQLRNLGAAEVRVFADEEDQAAGDNYLELAAAGTVGDYWEGPAEFFPQSVGNTRGEKTRGPVFMTSTGADATVVTVFFSRR